MNRILAGRPTAARLREFWKRFTKSRYRWILGPLAAFAVTRLIVFASGYLAEVAFPPNGVEYWHVAPQNLFLDVWARWDSGFYLNIAKNGYFFIPGEQSSVAFFPVYPLLTRLLTPLVGSFLAAGWLVSNLSLLGALLFLYKLTELEFGDSNTSLRAVFYLAAFPTAFFMSAVYTESTFLMLTVGTMYFARKRQWAWAALFGLMCSATRIIGVVMWGVTGLEWLKSHGWTLSHLLKRSAWDGLLTGLRRDWINLATISIMPLGLLSYVVFLQIKFGDPVAFSTTQSAWGRQMVGPVVVILNDLRALGGSNFMTGTNVWWHVVIDLTAFFAVIATLPIMWRRLGESYALYSLISMVVPASSASQSLSRYTLMIFPFFMLLGLWGKNALLDRAITIGFSVFLGIFTAVFVNWVFIA